MKNYFLSVVKRLPLHLVVLAALFLVFFSCSKEEMNESELNAGLQTEATVKANKAAPAPGELSIAEVAGEAGFSRLLEALVYVDEKLETQYVSLFSEGTDQYTVFAPTNAAFDAAYEVLGAEPETGVDAKTLETVLLYHVVEGRRAANSVVPPKNPKQIETLLGEYFWVNKQGMIDAIGSNAQITGPNNSASNGIIHVIDAVLLPIEL